jgi:hypothetical protein
MRRTFALLLCCLSFVAHAEQDAGTMEEVSFMDQPPDAGGYVTRVLVTERYLRMDYGQDRDDYVLFDRQAHRVYNVVHDQRQIMVIEPGAVGIPKPEKWQVKEDVLAEERGQRTFDIQVNGATCSRITASPTFLPDVARALGDFNELMVATQSATYLATPPEMRQPCDLARYIFETRLWVKSGFPMYEADADGSVRRLLSYQTAVPVRRGLFSLPDSYRTIRLRDMQGGAAAHP